MLTILSYVVSSVPSLVGSSPLVSRNDSAYVITLWCGYLVTVFLKGQKKTSQLVWEFATGEAHHPTSVWLAWAPPSSVTFSWPLSFLTKQSGELYCFLTSIKQVWLPQVNEGLIDPMTFWNVIYKYDDSPQPNWYLEQRVLPPGAAGSPCSIPPTLQRSLVGRWEFQPCVCKGEPGEDDFFLFQIRFSLYHFSSIWLTLAIWLYSLFSFVSNLLGIMKKIKRMAIKFFRLHLPRK